MMDQIKHTKISPLIIVIGSIVVLGVIFFTLSALVFIAPFATVCFSLHLFFKYKMDKKEIELEIESKRFRISKIQASRKKRISKDESQ